MKISIILPCRNEKETIGRCIKEIKKVLREGELNGEIIVSDSSEDGSHEIAKAEGAKVIKHDREGYGIALTEGVKHAGGDIIVYADADGTYNFQEIPKFLTALERSDIVIGNRMNGAIEKGAMPFSHRFFGTPLLNFFLFVLFGIKISDSQSGYRALKRETLEELDLKTGGMEFATEMIIKAKKKNIKIKEIPIDYLNRRGTSKLRPYRDGFAHLKYILMQAPLVFYFASGGILFLTGFVSLISSPVSGPLSSATVKILFPLIGVQLVFLGLFVKTYLHTKFDEENEFIRKFYSTFRLKTGIAAGLLFILVPVSLKILNLAAGIFDPLLVSAIIGFQIIFNSFILSSLSIK